MRKINFTTAIFLYVLLLSTAIYSQQYKWTRLANAPFEQSRFEDVFFIDVYTGWIVRSVDSNGVKLPNIFKTTNGGHSWINQADTTLIKGARCIGFANANTGWIGSINYEGGRIYKTTNGGMSWFDQFSGINVDTSYSICGISVVDENYVFGCGRWFAPATFYKTTNGGANWTITDMSQYATRLIDCKFINKDTGYVTGGSGIYDSSKSVILYTSDGGETWETKLINHQIGNFGWKIDLERSDTGYVSFQKSITPGYVTFAKTTSAGNKWEVKQISLSGFYAVQAIGFVNSTTGWIGGWYMNPFRTTNGGQTWTQNTWGYNLNRIRFLNDTLGYAVGQTVYKYMRDTSVNISTISTNIPESHNLSQNYPNPFNPETTIRFTVSDYENAKLTIYDVLGREIRVLVNQRFNPGIYDYKFDASGLESGIYFYKIETFHYTETKKMVLIK